MHLFGILYSTRSTEIMIASSVYEVQGENHALNIMSVEQHYSKTQLFFLLLSCSCIFKLFSLAPDHQFAKGCLQFFFPIKSTTKRQVKIPVVCSSLLLPIYIYFPNIDPSQISKGALLDILNPVQLQNAITFKQLSSDKSLINSH